MSAILLEQTIAYLRASFTRAQVAEIRTYAGEFSGPELTQIPFNAPAILVTCLGWKAEHHGQRLAGRLTRQVRMAAFIVTKHVDREKRMSQCMQIAEALAIALRLWAPDSTGLPVTLAGLEEDPRAENLYGRAVDAQGLALWLVDWQQCVKPIVDLPRLYDLLTIDITDHTEQGSVSDAPATGVAPTVTEDVQFNNLPPAA